MPKFVAVQVALLAGLALAVTFLVVQNRDLRDRVRALESKPSPAEAKVSAPTTREPEEFTAHRSEAVPPAEPAPSRQETAKPSTPSKPASPAVELTPAQEQAVAHSVEKILSEKYGHLPKPVPQEPLEKVLERELNLTASQKERIAALLKKKQEESGSIFKGGNPFSGANLQRAMEHDAKYDAYIKNELDASQQAKYDQLKKDGKIGGGITIQIDAGGDEE